MVCTVGNGAARCRQWWIMGSRRLSHTTFGLTLSKDLEIPKVYCGIRCTLGIRVSGRLSLKTARRGSGRTLTHPQRCAHGGRPCRAPRPRTAIVVSAVVGAAAAVGNGAHDRRLCARAAAPAHGAAGAASDGAWSWNINMRLEVEPLKT